MLSLKSMFCTLSNSAWMRMLWYERGNGHLTMDINNWHFLVLAGDRTTYARVSGGSRPSDKGEARSSISWDKGRARYEIFFFRPFGPQFGLKIRGSPAPPSPGSATGSACTSLSGGCEEVRWSIFQSNLNTWSHSTYIAAQDFELVRELLPRNSQIRQHKGLCDRCQNKFLQDNWILHLTLRRSWNLADHSLLVSLLDLKTQYYLLNRVKNDVTDHTCWELDWTSVPSR